jgi:hypothetical protein
MQAMILTCPTHRSQVSISMLTISRISVKWALTTDVQRGPGYHANCRTYWINIECKPTVLNANQQLKTGNIESF